MFVYVMFCQYKRKTKFYIKSLNYTFQNKTARNAMSTAGG